MRRLVGWLFAALVAVLPAVARATPPTSGAVEARGLFGISNQHGAALGVDLWVGSGTLRVGGTLGTGALSKGDGVTSRVLTPFGLSLALVPADDAQSGPTAVLRGGVYAGAQKGGFIAGPFAACALGYRVAIGEGASVRFGVDVWGLFLHQGSLFLGPFAGLGF